MATGEKSDKQLSWIYEGTKALVNREDYLLGKRLDKNFEMYSDAVVREKEDAIDTLVSGRVRQQPTTSKVSNLELHIVRKEDPLVAIKVREEKLRQEKLENPLMLMRMQRILREAMEKKEKKLRRKEEKAKRKEEKRRKASQRSEGDHSGEKGKHKLNKKEAREHSSSGKKHHRKEFSETKEETVGRKRRRHDSDLHNKSRSDESGKRDSFSSVENGRKLVERKKSRHDSDHQRKSHSDERRKHDRSSTDEEDKKTVERKRSRHDSDRYKESRGEEIRKHNRSPSVEEMRKKHDAKEHRRRNSCDEEASTSTAKHLGERSHETKKRKQMDSHIPEHLRPKHSSSSDSSSDSEPDQQKYQDEDEKPKIKTYGLVNVKKIERRDENRPAANTVKPASLAVSEPYKKPERRKLTKEEMEAKRKEMLVSAEWRDSSRRRNIERSAVEDEMEEKSNANKAADFIRPMLNQAASSMTVEKRLNSTRQGLQRGYGYMEQKFANR